MLESTLVGTANATSLENLAANAIKQRINSLTVGESITATSLVAAATSVSPMIKDLLILENGLLVDGYAHDPSVIYATEDDQYYAGTVTISVA